MAYVLWKWNFSNEWFEERAWYRRIVEGITTQTLFNTCRYYLAPK
jgi:hypothetical protein